MPICHVMLTECEGQLGPFHGVTNITAVMCRMSFVASARRRNRLGCYLKGVDIESANRPGVFITLGNDHVTVACYDLGGVVENDVSCLSSSNEHAGGKTLLINPMRTPNQFVISGEKNKMILFYYYLFCFLYSEIYISL